MWGLSCLLLDNLHWSLLPRSMSTIIKPSLGHLLLLDVYLENVSRCIKQSLSECHQLVVLGNSSSSGTCYVSIVMEERLNVYDGLNTCIDSSWFKLNWYDTEFLWQIFVLIWAELLTQITIVRVYFKLLQPVFMCSPTYTRTHLSVSLGTSSSDVMTVLTGVRLFYLESATSCSRAIILHITVSPV